MYSVTSRRETFPRAIKLVFQNLLHVMRISSFLSETSLVPQRCFFSQFANMVEQRSTPIKEINWSDDELVTTAHAGSAREILIKKITYLF